VKIIEGLKKIKDLSRKADDLRDKVRNHSALGDYETPKYKNQKQQITEWIQAHSDVLQEISRLKVAIQNTNFLTSVAIELDGRIVTKCIAAWIHRRRDLAGYELQMWQQLTDRGIKEGMGKSVSGEPMEVKIVRFYDPETKDKKVAAYSEEPSLIDAKLEIVNAVTELIE